MKKLAKLLRKLEILGDNINTNLEIATELVCHKTREVECMDYYIDATSYIDANTDKQIAYKTFIESLLFFYKTGSIDIFVIQFLKALDYDDTFPDFYYLMGKLSYAYGMNKASYKNLTKCLALLKSYDGVYPLILDENEIQDMIIRLELDS